MSDAGALAGCRWLLLLALAACGAGSASRFDSLTSCEDCVAAGFGWSVRKAKCGGYSNRDCSQCGSARHELAQAVDAALRRYEPCATPHECFGARIQHDLRHWQGGIRREAFAAAVEQLGLRRLSHYQIIDGQLYRDAKCMFEPRCRGIEYFIHWLLSEDRAGTASGPLPDMELLVKCGTAHLC